MVLITDMMKKIFAFINKGYIYFRAYTGNVLWPIALVFRRRKLQTVAFSFAKTINDGYILDVGTGPGIFPIEMANLTEYRF